MLTVFIVHIIITVSCLWSGYLFYNIVLGKNEFRPLIFYLLSGLILLTLLTQLAALFIPVSPTIKSVAGVLLMISAFIKWSERKQFFTMAWQELKQLNWPSGLLFICAWLIIILLNAGPVMMDDTESYHIQMIKWIQEYGPVPGLVNLHERYGFNSSWFSSVALFSFSSGTTGGFTVLNSVLSLWFCFWFISKINQQAKEGDHKSVLTILLVFIFCFAIWPMIRGNAATDNYDFITTVIVFVLFTETFLMANKDFSFQTEWVIWPAYLFTVRIINFPFIFLSLFALIIFFKQKKFKTILLLFALSLLLIVPFLARNIILTGYPFYPVLYSDWFNTDWKADPQQTEKLVEYIKYFNRVPTTYLDIEQTKTLGSNWIPTWFRHLFIYDKILVLIGLTGLITGLAWQFINKNNFNRKTSFFIITLLLWIVGWFIISPDPRFVYGCLLTGTLILVYQLISFFKIRPVLGIIIKVVPVLIILVSAFYFISKPIKEKEYRNWLRPAKLPQPPVKEITIEGITFRIPEPIQSNWNARCYGTDLPCLYKIDPRLKPRGKTISDGFRLEK